MLFFFYEDLVPKGLKQHRKRSRTGSSPAPDDGDVSYCEVATEWDCVGHTEEDEGNSHPYNDASTTSGPGHVHPTAAVDVYYHDAPPPAISGSRNFAIRDPVGSAQPRHVHDPALAFDDRVRSTRCDDQDTHTETWTYQLNGDGTVSQTSDGYGGGKTGSPGEWYG